MVEKNYAEDEERVARSGHCRRTGGRCEWRKSGAAKAQGFLYGDQQPFMAL
jgi:hypothetical protein